MHKYIHTYIHTYIHALQTFTVRFNKRQIETYKPTVILRRPQTTRFNMFRIGFRCIHAQHVDVVVYWPSRARDAHFQTIRFLCVFYLFGGRARATPTNESVQHVSIGLQYTCATHVDAVVRWRSRACDAHFQTIR